MSENYFLREAKKIRSRRFFSLRFREVIMPVRVLRGNIFDGGTDLTVLPCSAKPSVTKSTRNWIEMFDLADPVMFKYGLEHGGVSRLYRFRHGSKKTKYYIYGAAVLNDHSTPEIVTSIARRIGNITNERPEIRNVECVLLGAGAGGLRSTESACALAVGFQETANPAATLIIYSMHEDVCVEIRKAIASVSMSSVEQIIDKINVKPGLFGISVDLNGVKASIVRKISSYRNRRRNK